jgi:anaerobic magnesium-protoporphyrin IX monomethyl ester cyclase
MSYAHPSFSISLLHLNRYSEKREGWEHKGKMKFSFVNPGPNPDLSIQDRKKMIAASPPLGVLYIATLLKNEGIEVSILDQAAKGLSIRDVIDWVNKEDPDILGFSTLISSGRTAAMISEEVKKENPNPTIVFGNYYGTFNAERILRKYPSVDVIVRGEGEYTSLELVKYLKGGEDLKHVLGVTFRKEDQVVSTSDRPLVKDVDALPFPDRDLLEVEYHSTTAGVNVAPKKFSSFISSRGCVFRCRFCGCRKFAHNRWRPRSVENILEELQLLESQGYRQFLFVDDNFTLDQKRVIKLCRRIRKERMDIEWICEGRVDGSPLVMLRELVKAGCRMFYLGIESASQKVLDYYDKQATTQQARIAVKNARKAGVDVIVGSFIVGAPNETRQEIEKTLKFAEELKIDVPQFNVLSAFAGTDIWEELKTKGFLDEEQYWETGVMVPEICPDAVPYEEITGMIHAHFRHFLLRPDYILSQGLRMMKSSYRMNLLVNNLSRISEISESVRHIA